MFSPRVQTWSWKIWSTNCNSSQNPNSWRQLSTGNNVTFLNELYHMPDITCQVFCSLIEIMRSKGGLWKNTDTLIGGSTKIFWQPMKLSIKNAWKFHCFIFRVMREVYKIFWISWSFNPFPPPTINKCQVLNFWIYNSRLKVLNSEGIQAFMDLFQSHPGIPTGQMQKSSFLGKLCWTLSKILWPVIYLIGWSGTQLTNVIKRLAVYSYLTWYTQYIDFLKWPSSLIF